MPSFADEVIRLHDFFNDWYSGRAQRRFSDFSDAMHEDFVLVPPSGEVIQRADVISMIDSGRATEEVTVSTEDHIVHHEGEVTVGTYIEVTVRPHETLRRVSTAVMKRDTAAPGGWSWLSVHETWIGGRPQAES